MNNVVKLASVATDELQAVSDKLTPATVPTLLFDSTDFCAALRISPATMHRLRAAGKLPRAMKLGSQLRWDAEEVRKWVKAGMPPLREWEARKAAERGRA